MVWTYDIRESNNGSVSGKGSKSCIGEVVGLLFLCLNMS